MQYCSHPTKATTTSSSPPSFDRERVGAPSPSVAVVGSVLRRLCFGLWCVGRRASVSMPLILAGNRIVSDEGLCPFYVRSGYIFAFPPSKRIFRFRRVEKREREAAKEKKSGKKDLSFPFAADDIASERARGEQAAAPPSRTCQPLHCRHSN